MIKVKGHDVEMCGKLGDLTAEISYILSDFISNLPDKSKDMREASSRAVKGIIFLTEKKLEENGFDAKITDEERAEFEDSWKKSKEKVAETEKLLKLLKSLASDDDDEDSEDSDDDDDDDDDGVIGMCAIPANSKKGKAIMDILGIKQKDTKDDDETEDDIPHFLF